MYETAHRNHNLTTPPTAPRHRYRMKASTGPSIFDGKPSLILDYRGQVRSAAKSPAPVPTWPINDSSESHTPHNYSPLLPLPPSDPLHPDPIPPSPHTKHQHEQPHYLGHVAQMFDEVRMVEPGLYLGLGTMGPLEAMRNQPFPFLLRGPYNRLDPAEVPAIVQKGVAIDAEQGPGSGDAAWGQQP